MKIVGLTHWVQLVWIAFEINCYLRIPVHNRPLHLLFPLFQSLQRICEKKINQNHRFCLIQCLGDWRNSWKRKRWPFAEPSLLNLQRMRGLRRKTTTILVILYYWFLLKFSPFTFHFFKSRGKSSWNNYKLQVFVIWFLLEMGWAAFWTVISYLWINPSSLLIRIPASYSYINILAYFIFLRIYEAPIDIQINLTLGSLCPF